MQKFLFAVFIFFQILLSSCAQNAENESSAPRAPKGYANETFLKIAYALKFLDLIDTEPEVPENIEVFKNLTYKHVDSIDLNLDIYRSRNLKQASPVLIFIHGGSWSKGKRSDYLPYLLDYAQKNYITATVSYRLSGKAKFPAALEDVKCAVRWIRANASKYKIDPDRIAVIGGSAGGHLAMMLGYSDENDFVAECQDSISSQVNAIVNFYGPVDLTTPYAREQGACTSFLGYTYAENQEIYSDASPKKYISNDDPPTLTFHGTIDSLVPVSQADSLQKWLDKAGVQNEYHRLKGWPHTTDLSKKVNKYCQYYMDAFFKKYLH